MSTVVEAAAVDHGRILPHDVDIVRILLTMSERTEQRQAAAASSVAAVVAASVVELPH